MSRKQRLKNKPAEGTLGRRIQDQRRSACLTQAQVAEHCHVTQSAVAAWERNEHEPALRVRRLLAEALYLHPSLLFIDAENDENAAASA